MEWILENDKWWGYGKWLVDTEDGEEWNVRAAGPSVILATYPTLEEAKAKVEELHSARCAKFVSKNPKSGEPRE